MPGGAGQGGPGGVGAGPGSFSAEEARQLTRELRAQRDAAEALRRSLAGTGADTRDLDQAINRLGALDGAKILGNPAALEQMRSGAVENVKAFEFALRRKLGAAETGGPALGGNDNVPPQYRDMVSEYFKSLAKKP